MMATKKDSENRAGLGTGVGGIRGCQNSRLVFVVVRPLIYQTGNRNFFRVVSLKVESAASIDPVNRDRLTSPSTPQ